MRERRTNDVARETSTDNSPPSVPQYAKLSRRANRDDIPIRVVYIDRAHRAAIRQQVRYANEILRGSAKINVVKWIKLSKQQALEALGAEQGRYRNSPLISDPESWKTHPDAAKLDMSVHRTVSGEYDDASLEMAALINTHGADDVPTVFIVPEQESNEVAMGGLAIEYADLDYLEHEAIIINAQYMTESTLLHEVGHLAGLKHSEDKSDVMYHTGQHRGDHVTEDEHAHYRAYAERFVGRGKKRHRG